MDRIHMYRTTNDELIELDLCERVYLQKAASKPTGFWYGIDNSWIEWCESEMPEWVTPHRYRLEIDMAEVLVVDTIEKMHDINKHSVTDEYPPMLHYPTQTFQRFNYNIDWTHFEKKGYKGIEIPRYMYELRMNHDFFWYYSWDVASGCIWDTSIIKSVTKL